MTYSFHPAAESEYLEAVAFYEARRPGLGASFLVEFERTLESVCAAPNRFRVERLPDVRRAGLRRFPCE